jgi:uncharacterized membrane protein
VSSSLREWLNLGVRWIHVFAGIMWVGQTYYFTWLDGQFGKLEKASSSNIGTPSVWMVHSGGFYAVEKQTSLGVSADKVRWFRWEAMTTWLAGIVLLVLVYYMGSGLIDPDVLDISQPVGVVIGVASIVLGWLIYDALVPTRLGKSPAGFAAVALALVAAASWGLLHLFSGRAAYIHLGAIFGSIMTANVWFRILPAQRKMITAAAAGTAFDPALGAQAKLRSKHNTFMAVPVVFLMLSNHYPVATYGSQYNWPVLVGLVVLGWGAAKVIREA